MPSHEIPPFAAAACRRRLLAGFGLLMMSAAAVSAPAVALPAPPARAEAVDWDHFGEPSLSTARRANVAVSRALRAPAVDTQLYRLPGDVVWEQVLSHYRQGAGSGWKPVAGADRVETGSPARQQRFTAAGRGLAVVWLPPLGEGRDGLLMVLSTRPSR